MPFGLVEVSVLREEPGASIPTPQMAAASPPPPPEMLFPPMLYDVTHKEAIMLRDKIFTWTGVMPLSATVFLSYSDYFLPTCCRWRRYTCS